MSRHPLRNGNCMSWPERERTDAEYERLFFDLRQTCRTEQAVKWCQFLSRWTNQPRGWATYLEKRKSHDAVAEQVS